MYKPTFGHTSAKTLSIKDLLDSVRSPSNQKDETNIRKSRQSPQVNKTSKADSDQPNQNMLHIQQRYVQLQKNYKELLQKARLRNIEHLKLKEQLKHYQKQHQRDSQQIEHLRTIIGLVNKKSAETQVSQEEIEWNLPIRNSRVNKFDQSTQDEIKFKMSNEKFYPKEKEKVFRKEILKDVTFRESKKQRLNESRSKLKESRVRQSREKTQPIQSTQSNTKGLLLQYEKQLKRVGSGTGKKLSNSPYSQLRFVPGFKK